jgi:glycosyltransferase involved in cell wall biosynthesis
LRSGLTLRCLDVSYSTTRRVILGLPTNGPGTKVASRIERLEGGLRLRGYGKLGWRDGGEPIFPLISIVTVVRNGDRHLDQAIRSVLEQEYDNVEYVLVDGASTDGTLAVVRRHGDALDYWLSEPDAGLYDAMNKGIALANGDVIGILNSDDHYEAGTLRAVAKTFVDTGADYAYGSVIRMDEAGRRVNVTHPLPPEEFGRKCVREGPFPHPSLFVRREVYQRIGAFDTDFKIAADRDFIARMIFSGHKGERLPGIVVCMRGGGVSDGLPRWSETRRVARKHGIHVSRAFAFHLVSACKIGLARTLPRPIMKRLLQLIRSRHQWVGGS